MNFEEYEREGRATYADLAATTAVILRAAITAEGSYRLQQVMARAKEPVSLHKKLIQRDIALTATIENEIKDLAGCRVIFYTNSDVTRFINSGIIEQNFEVLEVKYHHPRHEVDDATELYISNHYLIRLRPERIALPEYARFEGMRCEIQIQTILNHSWAEMAHDTIYKSPTFGDFGGEAFAGIKNRMQKVARKYLLPAGYEFQKIASDFQRIVEGKALFDGDALEAVVEAADNNVRAQALETFAESVLPFYDDPQTVYPEIVERLLAAANRARETAPVIIETPYGAIPAKAYGDIIKAITTILAQYRYLDVDRTFDALCKLYGWTVDQDERKPLIELGKSLAKNNLKIWRENGPFVQSVLVDRIKTLDEDECRTLWILLTAMLGEILGTEVRGTTNSSNTVTIHQGAVTASDSLRAVRKKAIELLKRQFALAESDMERNDVLIVFQSATRQPTGAVYSNALAQLIIEDTHEIIEFLTGIAPTLNFKLLQSTEHWIHRCYWNYAELPDSMRDDMGLVAARNEMVASALTFRDVANADPDFVIYKTLVGYNSVFQPAWEDKEFRFKMANAYRSEQVDMLLNSVEESTADAWFDRISRYAQTRSDDAATFPVLGKFIERMAQNQPAIVYSFLDKMVGPLENFMPGVIAGLMQSANREPIQSRINVWLGTGDHIGEIAWYLRFSDPFDEHLLRSTLDSAIQYETAYAVRNVLIAAVDQFAAHPGTLIETVFLPALSYLNTAGDLSWVTPPWFSWLDCPIIKALSEEQAKSVLDALIPYPNLEGSAEHITAAIAIRWPAIVVTFFGERLKLASTKATSSRYDAIPFSVYELKLPLAKNPDIVLDGARSWFEANPLNFTYDGGRLLASLYQNLEGGLGDRLEKLISSGNAQDLTFVLAVLSAFEGKDCIYSIVREIVAILDPTSILLNEARNALCQSGVVHGEFGFAELHVQRKAKLEEWLVDPRETVQMFATELILDFDRLIAAENRSAEASIALRKLNYGEELDNDK